MILEYTPQGICASHISVEVEDGVVQAVRFDGGCPGNHLGLEALARGMKVEDVIARLEGIRCRTKPTSCPDQLAQALKQALACRDN